MPQKASDLSSLAQLMNSEKYSDLILVCDEQVFKVHKAIVCTQSPEIAEECDSASTVKPPPELFLLIPACSGSNLTL
jgi:BTB/POZ domain